jgi:hypothetical protein
VVECGGLENRYGRFTSIEGSNPSPSAVEPKYSPEQAILATVTSPCVTVAAGDRSEPLVGVYYWRTTGGTSEQSGQWIS